MAKRLSDEERQRRAQEKARKKREREAAREAKRKAKAEEKALKAQEKEERRRQKEIARGQRMKRRPRWLYWLVREQAAKKREHEQYMNAGRVALALGQAIRKVQQKIMRLIGPLIDHAATLETPEARMVWTQEPWTPQDRTRYNWGQKQELQEIMAANPDGIVEQDPEEAAADAKRKTKARKINHAKAISKVLDSVTKELAEDEQNAVRSSLEKSYGQVYEDIYKELQDGRRAIDADRDDETRIADARDITGKRRTAPEKQIPQNMPRFGNYGESVIFEAPSPDQVKAVLNAEFEGKDYSARIWKDREKLETELKDMMTAAIINGENSRTVAQKLAQRMGVEFSHAQRLIRTEMNRILNQSILDQAKASGAEKYQFVTIEDNRTCSRCLKKNGRIYRIAERRVGLNCPPLHPHCRCTIIARYAWEDEDDDTPTTTTPEDDSGTQKTIEAWLKEVEAINKAKADAVRNTPTKANAAAAVEAQDAAMKSEEQQQQEALGRQRRAIQQGKPVKAENVQKKEKRVITDAKGESVTARPTNGTQSAQGGKMIEEKGEKVKIKSDSQSRKVRKNAIRPRVKPKTSGAISTDPKTRQEQKELDALAENLYEQKRRATRDIKRIAQSTGWPEDRIARIKNYVFNQKHELYPGEPPERFAASMGMIQSWRRMAKGDPKALENHDILLLQHEWLEMEIKNQNPGIEHQKAHDLANQTYCYSKAEEAYNDKSKRLSISERTRRKGSLLPRKQ